MLSEKTSPLHVVNIWDDSSDIFKRGFTHTVKKIGPWFGFTKNKVLGMVMENEEFYKYLLEVITPDLKIRKIGWLDRQVEINNSGRKNNAKEVRLDILITGHEDHVFSIEMQTTGQDGIGKWIRYYLSRIDLHYTLNKGKACRNLKDTFTIFLCNFKPKKDDKFYESCHTYSGQDRPKQLQDGVIKVIINSQVSVEGQSEDLRTLAKLMNNEPVNLSKHFDYAQGGVKEINKDPETREKVMFYEIRMLERERAATKIAGKVVYAEGRKDGVEQGKVGSARVTLENQMDNGGTLEQATEFVRNLKLTPNEGLGKIVAMYK